MRAVQLIEHGENPRLRHGQTVWHEMSGGREWHLLGREFARQPHPHWWLPGREFVRQPHPEWHHPYHERSACSTSNFRNPGREWVRDERSQEMERLSAESDRLLDQLHLHSENERLRDTASGAGYGRTTESDVETQQAAHPSSNASRHEWATMAAAAAEAEAEADETATIAMAAAADVARTEGIKIVEAAAAKAEVEAMKTVKAAVARAEAEGLKVVVAAAAKEKAAEVAAARAEAEVEKVAAVKQAMAVARAEAEAEKAAAVKEAVAAALEEAAKQAVVTREALATKEMEVVALIEQLRLLRANRGESQ
mmetsp:Transcript_23584/g.47112  ORF Transcript_23584/g.47112 Transcript_23584/m.47112 type:complete len:310 (-) Transcript_23584:178-1107(-)